MSFWALIAAAGAGTLAMRVVPMLAHGRFPTPRWLERLLRYVPAASLAALAVPGSIVVGSPGAYHAEPARIAAIAVALAVALRSRNVLLTLAAGMATLWTLQALASRLG